jgi:hypothetical protein
LSGLGNQQPPPLAIESLQGFVMLICGHFQGFCRDLYTECVQICALQVPSAMQAAVQLQFGSELKLSAGNPNTENLRKDFERFGFTLDFAGADPLNPQRLTDLGHLNYWRNAVAHQKATPPPQGVPQALTLPMVKRWKMSCDGLAASLDNIMFDELSKLIGGAPW